MVLRIKINATKAIKADMEENFGKAGFRRKTTKKTIKPINIDELERKLKRLLVGKKIIKEGDLFVINLSSIGYDKLLRRGNNISARLKITVDTASEKAIAKAKEKGAEVGTKKEEPK